MNKKDVFAMILQSIKQNSRDFDGEAPDSVMLYRLDEMFDYKFEIKIFKGEKSKSFYFFNTAYDLIYMCLQVPYLKELIESEAWIKNETTES